MKFLAGASKFLEVAERVNEAMGVPLGISPDGSGEEVVGLGDQRDVHSVFLQRTADHMVLGAEDKQRISDCFTYQTPYGFRAERDGKTATGLTLPEAKDNLRLILQVQ